MTRRKATTKGFASAQQLLSGPIRRASESRGFAQSKLLTHWAEIAGDAIAAVTRPVEVRYAKGGFGATLTLLTTGAHAPMVEMQKDALRDKVNAIYGYNAISRIRITQTAATGFSEGQVAFDTRGATEKKADPILPAASAAVAPVKDDGLRLALERLGSHILTKQKSRNLT